MRHINGWKTCLALALALMPSLSAIANESTRPNVLFCIADDWGWPDAGAYGQPVVRTNAFDRIAKAGVLFENAFVTAPSCTPSRSSILTGQYHWRLDQAANLHSSLDPKHPTYPEILKESGYQIGHWRKAWGPGRWNALGRTEEIAGPNFKSFEKFLEAREADRPFCFWLGSSDPHRPYKKGTGAKHGFDPAKIRVPADLPDTELVRNDIADYYFEVERFNNDVNAAMDLLEQRGELDNTLIVITGDHGMPFPRHKCQLYDSGTHVPLAISWPAQIPPNRTVTDFVSLADVAPTFLEAAGAELPGVMTGTSILSVLISDDSGRVDEQRDHVLAGRERHTQCQELPVCGGYPMRAIRTDKYLYIRNFEPTRWPAGTPDAQLAWNGRVFGDCDGSPTKDFMISETGKAQFSELFDLAFAKRPAEELYILSDDPGQLNNVAEDPKWTSVKTELSKQIMAELQASEDPRVIGGGEAFDTYPYYGKAKPAHK